MEGVLQGFDTFMNLVISDGVEIKRKNEVIIVNEDFLRIHEASEYRTQGERKDIGLVVLRGKSVQSLRVLEPFKKPLPQWLMATT